jgi:hypothetical protein
MIFVQSMKIHHGGNSMSEKIIAWENEEAKQDPPKAAWIYEDQVVAKDHWEKVDDHEIEGLAVYRKSGSAKEQSSS